MVTIFKNSKHLNCRLKKKTNNKIHKRYFFFTKTAVLCNIGDLAKAYEEDKTVNSVIYFDNKRNKLKGRS